MSEAKKVLVPAGIARTGILHPLCQREECTCSTAENHLSPGSTESQLCEANKKIVKSTLTHGVIKLEEILRLYGILSLCIPKKKLADAGIRTPDLPTYSRSLRGRQLDYTGHGLYLRYSTNMWEVRIRVATVSREFDDG